MRAETARQLEENYARIASLCQRMETLARKESLTRKEAEGGLREVRAAIDEPGPLTRSNRAALLPRLKAARSALFPRVQELREADEWPRWANPPCRRTSASRWRRSSAEENLDRRPRRLRDLDERWKDVPAAPKDEGEALWRRFKTARDQVFGALQALFARRRSEQAENLKEGSALRAGRSADDSTDWLKTAERCKRLQAEWKTIGPVSPHAQAIWERFRTPATLLHAAQGGPRPAQGRVARNLERKEALCVQAEALAQSTEWERPRPTSSACRPSGRAIGPVRKNKSEAIWQRFRAACDTFFERYKKRDTWTAGPGGRCGRRWSRSWRRSPAPEPAEDLAEKVKRS